MLLLYQNNRVRLTGGIAAQLSILEFTLVQWGALRGHTGDEGNITPTLQLTVLHIKLLSRLRHTHIYIFVLAGVNDESRASLNLLWCFQYKGLQDHLYLIILAVGVFAAT